jgi:glycosyltransferase involved in cell wall biosynthesis
MAKIPIVMKLWAGAEAHDFEYIARSVPSLLQSDLPDGIEVLLFDDASTDPRLKGFLRQVSNDRRVRVFTSDVNKGPNRGQADAYARVEAEYPDAPYFINVDDDVVYNRRWLLRLQEAQGELGSMGVRGVYTALNMPFRRPHATIRTRSGTYLLKWKQPALNWLIPRDVYERTNRFADEGVAYDTVYSHWLRLRGYSVICVTPSYVQNVGTFGAYSKDKTTTAEDFIGEGDGSGAGVRFARRVWGTSSRWARELRHQLDDVRLVAPVRWGADMVYEGVTRHGASVAVCGIDDAVRLGWHPEAVAARAAEVQGVHGTGRYRVRGVARSLRGEPRSIEYDWRFLPNLREWKQLRRGDAVVEVRRLATSLCEELAPFHRAGVVHNKIRRDNVYLETDGRGPYLAWLGTEPPRRALRLRAESAIELFGQAVDKRTVAAVRERCAASYCESIAPEVLEGEAATLRSDIFALGATLLFHLHGDVPTLAEVAQVRSSWTAGPDPRLGELGPILARSVAFDPAARFASATELGQALGASAGGG